MEKERKERSNFWFWVAIGAIALIGIEAIGES
jgi:hypothetical protein